MQHLTSVAYQAASLLAADGGPALNTSGAVEWAVKNILPFAFLIIGLYMIFGAKSGKLSDNAKVATNMIFGLMIIAGGAILWAFSGQLVRLVFGA